MFKFKNKIIILGLSILSFFGLNGLVNKTAKADTITNNNTATQQNNYEQKMNQLVTVPKVQQNTQPQVPTYPTQQNSNFKSDISNQANQLQNKIVNHGIKNTTVRTKSNVGQEEATNSTHHRHHKYYRVSEAKNLVYQGQGNTDACEMASVKNVLSIHHKAMNTSMDTMINRIGWNKNWNHGYTGNPYTRSGVTISPKLEAKLLREYGVKAHVHNYISKREAIKDLKRGMQFVVEAGHRCYSYHVNHTVSDHILDIIGIKRNHHGLFVQYVEPNTNRYPVAWCPFKRFWDSYNRSHITSNRLVVAGYK